MGCVIVRVGREPRLVVRGIFRSEAFETREEGPTMNTTILRHTGTGLVSSRVRSLAFDDLAGEMTGVAHLASRARETYR